MTKHDMFKDYPDIVNIQQLRSMLGEIGMKRFCSVLFPTFTPVTRDCMILRQFISKNSISTVRSTMESVITR